MEMCSHPAHTKQLTLSPNTQKPSTSLVLPPCSIPFPSADYPFILIVLLSSSPPSLPPAHLFPPPGNLQAAACPVCCPSWRPGRRGWGSPWCWWWPGCRPSALCSCRGCICQCADRTFASPAPSPSRRDRSCSRSSCTYLRGDAGWWVWIFDSRCFGLLNKVLFIYSSPKAWRDLNVGDLWTWTDVLTVKRPSCCCWWAQTTNKAVKPPEKLNIHRVHSGRHAHTYTV